MKYNISTDGNNQNAYVLFLILILLILSNDVLAMIKHLNSKKPVQKKTENKGFRTLPVTRKINKGRDEPKKETQQGKPGGGQ